ncbi:isochorismatase family protein [Corynebacterium sp. H127]|uniref:isochorismatase family protein n=1 Tax=Corynebacterium sp. H127 TaxID=3133418 RepID=UPI00309C2C57
MTGPNHSKTPQQRNVSRALIVVDVQNDFCPGGTLATEEGGNVAKKIAALLSNQDDYAVVVATQDWHIDPGEHFSDAPDFVNSWPVHCVAQSDGADFHPALQGYPFDAVFRKGEYAAAYSGFEGADHGTSLNEYLLEHAITNVDIVGIATDYCVRATALDAVANGYVVRILTDYVAAVAETTGVAALSDIAREGATVVDGSSQN